MQNVSDIKFFLVNDFGLSDNETAVYIGLLEKGRATVLDLSKALNMNRTTVHVNVEYLLQKGIVSQTQEGRGKKRLIIPEPPERLRTIVEQRKIKVLKTEEKLAEMIPQMSNLMKGSSGVANVEVKYYEGKENVQLLYHEILKSDSIKAYGSNKIVKIFPNNFELFVKAHTENPKMKIWDVLDFKPHDEYVKAMGSDRYFYKLIPSNLEFPDFLIYGDSVAVVDCTEDNDVLAIVIKSVNMVTTSTKLFDLVWNISK